MFVLRVWGEFLGDRVELRFKVGVGLVVLFIWMV